MKQPITHIFIILLLISPGLFAQSVYNHGFEILNSDGTLSNWGNVYLENVWLDSLGNPHTDSIVYDGPYYAPTTDANNGLTAMELRNSWDYTTNHGRSGAAAVDEDSIFSAYGLFNFIPTYATPFQPFEPFNFGLYYKFTPVNGDTAYAEITLLDSSSNQIGYGLILIIDSATTFTHIDAPVNYTTLMSADFYSLNVGTFYTVEPGSHDPSFGTRLIVDDIGFNFVTSVNEVKKSNIDLFPNPSSGIVHFTCQQEMLNKSYEVLDISGRVVFEGKITGEKMRINLGNLEKGVYYLCVQANSTRIILTNR
jgi:hypothetical protein